MSAAQNQRRIREVALPRARPVGACWVEPGLPFDQTPVFAIVSFFS